MMFTSKIYTFMVLVILTLTGCGGGGVSGGSSEDTSAPSFTSAASANVAENQTSAIDVNASDASAITFSLASAVNDNDDFNIDANTGIVTFKTAPDFETKNSYTIRVTASDARSNSTNQTITITITDVDEIAPTFTSSATTSVSENQTAALTVVATDTSTPIVYSLNGGTDVASFSINSSTGVLTFNSAPDFETKNSYTLTVRATDNLGNSADQSLTISINDVDEISPTITSANSASVNENQTTAITVTATDASLPIVYSLNGGTDVALVSINSSSGLVTFNTAPDFESGKTSYVFGVRAADNLGNISSTQTVTITINDVSDETPPVITSSATTSVNENQTAAFTATATDVSTPIVYSLAGTDAAAFAINSSTGVITFNTAPDFETKNSYSLIVRATDNFNNVSSQNVTITINDISDETAPSITSSATASVNENQTSAITIVATDPSAPIVYSITGTDAASFSVNSSSGVVTFNTAPDFETKNSYTFTAEATDNFNNKASQSVTITILDIGDEDAPNITSANSASVNENQTSAIDVNATDASNPIVYSISGTDAASFSINSSSGVVTFNTAPDFESGKTSYTFTATATDNVGNVANQSITITILDVVENITHGGLTYNQIVSPITGRTWLDRNMGATAVCTKSRDDVSFASDAAYVTDQSTCFGDYYQWGRLADGHEKIASSNSATRITDILLTSGGDFVTNASTPFDWVQNTTQDTNNIDDDGLIRNIQWAKTNASAVCPSGYRIPTTAELEAETIADSIQDIDSGGNGNIEVVNRDTAFKNFLKIPATGYRKRNDGALDARGSYGYLWTNTTSGITSTNLIVSSPNALTQTSSRAAGYPIRCVKDSSSNVSPTANAGADQTVITGSTVNLDGTSSTDPDGSITAYEWKDGGTTLSTSSTFSKNDFSIGTHIVTLIITDDSGAKSFDTTSITILPTTITSGGKTYGLLVSPVTGKIWLDRNIGADRVCTASVDSQCYGNRYQWGRPNDGHETFSGGTTGTTSATLVPGITSFITSGSDWVNGGVDDNGALRVAESNKLDNSVACPISFRVPTKAELSAETIDAGVIGKDTQVTSGTTAFANFLKLGVSGYRRGDNGNLTNDGIAGVLWTNTPTTSPNEAEYLSYRNGTGASMSILPRGYAMPIRCIRD